MAKNMSSIRKTVKRVGKPKTTRRLSSELKSLLARAERARREFKYKEAVDLYTLAIDSHELDPAREFEARFGRSTMWIDHR